MEVDLPLDKLPRVNLSAKSTTSGSSPARRPASREEVEIDDRSQVSPINKARPTPSSPISTSSCSDMEDSSSPDILSGGYSVRAGVGAPLSSDGSVSPMSDALGPTATGSIEISSSGTTAEPSSTLAAASASRAEPVSPTGVLATDSPPRLWPREPSPSFALPGYCSSSSEDFCVSRVTRTGKGKKRMRSKPSSVSANSTLSSSYRPALPATYSRSPPPRRERTEPGGGEGDTRNGSAAKEGDRVAAPGARGSESTYRRNRLASSARVSSSSSSSVTTESLPNPPPQASPSALEVLDLSVSSPREIIDIDDVEDHSQPPLLSPPPRRRKGDGPGLGRGGGGGGGGGASGVGSGAHNVELAGGVAPASRRPSAVRGSEALRSGGRRRASPAASSDSSLHAGDRGRGDDAALGAHEGEDNSNDLGRRQRQRSLRPLGAAAAGSAGGGGAGRRRSSRSSDSVVDEEDSSTPARILRHASRDGQRLAARLQREESSLQEQSDAEMARRLQSEEENVASDWIRSATATANGGRIRARERASRAGASGRGGRGGESSSDRGGGGSSGGRGAYSFVGGRGGSRGSSAAGRGRSTAAEARSRRQQSSGRSRAAEVARELAHLMMSDMTALSSLPSGRGRRGGGAGAGAGGNAGMALMSRELTPADYAQLLALDDSPDGRPRAKGLSPEEMSMLPRQTGNGTGPTEQCCICMDDMTSTQSITRLPACLHTFHSKCISQWLEGHSTCPIDKAAVNVNDAS